MKKKKPRKLKRLAKTSSSKRPKPPTQAPPPLDIPEGADVMVIKSRHSHVSINTFGKITKVMHDANGYAVSVPTRSIALFGGASVSGHAIVFFKANEVIRVATADPPIIGGS